MIVTDTTRRILYARRETRRLLAAGYEHVGESGGRLWELYRGDRVGQRITDVVIAPDGISLFVKIG